MAAFVKIWSSCGFPLAQSTPRKSRAKKAFGGQAVPAPFLSIRLEAHTLSRGEGGDEGGLFIWFAGDSRPEH